MAIVPDDKNWTWVLEQVCPDCGFDAAAIAPTTVAQLLRDNVTEWSTMLAHSAVRQRPSDDQWSALEYACHVRDVFALFETRLALMLNEDGPTFANWDQDVTAIESRYDEQDPAVVLAELTTAGLSMANALDGVAPTSWQRTGLRSDGAMFTVDTFARYFLHDPTHHVVDVRNGYARLAAR
jgi:hypothetical protein